MFSATALAANWPSTSGIKTYVISNYNDTVVYQTANSTARYGTIYANDLITILGYEGNRLKVSYPINNGRNSKIGYIDKSKVTVSNINQASSTFTATGTITAYRRSNGNATIGSISRNDTVYVIATSGSRAQVIYPISGGYKMGWIACSDIPASGRNVQPVAPTQISTKIPLSDGWYRIQPMHDLGRSADALGPQIGNGNNVHMWSNVDVLQQKFYLQNRGNGYFSLQSAYGNRLFVTANGNSNGANLYTSAWSNSDSQLFRLVDAGNNSYHIVAKVGANLNFDCAGGGRSDGNNVQLWTKETGSAWHKWRFTPVSVNSTYVTVENWDAKVGQHLANENSVSYQKPTNPFNKSYTSSKDGRCHATNCTWYAWGRMREVTGKEISFSSGSRNGGEWHLRTNWDSNLTSRCVAERNGHVAFVEYVDEAKGKVYFTEVNWNVRDDYKVQVSTISTFKSKFKWFIH